MKTLTVSVSLVFFLLAAFSFAEEEPVRSQLCSCLLGSLFSLVPCAISSFSALLVF